MPPPPAEHRSAPGRNAALVVLLALVGGLGLNYAIIQPLHVYLLDFRAYYAAGLALQAGVNPYDVEAVRAAVDLPGQQNITAYLYPPPTLPLAWAVSRLPYPGGQLPWCLLQLALLVAAFWLVLRGVDCALASAAAVLVAFAFFTSAPVQQLFHWGQFDMVPLVLLAAAFLALQRGRRTAAGLSLGLAVVAKVTPLLYVGVLLVRREKAAVATALLTVLATLAAAWLWLGGEVFGQWLRALSTLGSRPATLSSPENMSLLAYMYRALANQPNAHGESLPWIDLGRGAAQAATLAALGLIAAVTLWWMVRNRRRLSSAECLAAAVPVALLTSSVTWVHHGVQLLLPLAVVSVAVARQPRMRVLDAGWLAMIILLYANWPMERFQLGLPSRLAHLVGPTMTYATGLLWLMMVVRYVPLKLAAACAAATHAGDVRALAGTPDAAVPRQADKHGSTAQPGGDLAVSASARTCVTTD
jgi:hypothetical protein